MRIIFLVILISLLNVCPTMANVVFYDQYIITYFMGHNIKISEHAIAYVNRGDDSLVIYCLQEDKPKQIMIDNHPLPPFHMALVTKDAIQYAEYNEYLALKGMPEVAKLDDKVLNKICKSAVLQINLPAPQVCNPNKNCTVKPI